MIHLTENFCVIQITKEHRSFMDLGDNLSTKAFHKICLSRTLFTLVDSRKYRNVSMRETVIEIINTEFILTSEAKTILTNGLLSFILNVFEQAE